MNKKIQTILFGAGKGCKEYMRNTASKRNFLAICDNDEKKHGTVFEGLMVIPAHTIHNYDFDEIVITTQWFNEVTKQLQALNINPAAIVIPKKEELKQPKPFVDDATHTFATSVLLLFANKAYEQNIEIFVDTGTLLGVVRNGEILRWDDDIDFAFDISKPNNDAKKLLEWVETVLAKNYTKKSYHIQTLYNSDNQIVDISVDFLQKNLKAFRLSFNIRNNVGKNSIELASLGMFYAPAKYFAFAEILDFQGVKLQVPNNYKEYLCFVYGEWEKEKKEITMADYNHTNEVDFATIQQAGLHTK